MADLQVLYSISQEDYLGVPVSHDIFVTVPDTTTLASLITNNQAYQAVYDGVTGNLLTASTIRVFAPRASGLKDAPIEGDEAEKGGLFNFSSSSTRYKNGIFVPGIRETAIANGKIDLTNGGVQAWITWITTAHAGITVVSKFLNVLQALVDALISFRKHRKAENRRSIEGGA